MKCKNCGFKFKSKSK